MHIRRTVAARLSKQHDLLSTAEAGEILGIARNTVLTMLKDGRLKGFISKGTYYVLKTSLIDYMAEHEKAKRKAERNSRKPA